jgi:hypothetical protein
MLDGIDSNEIIVGAYTDRSGRVCPMLAAHRHGGRTSLASFARAWDSYTGATKRGRPRPATDREIRTLRAMLEASMWSEEATAEELSAAASDHRASIARRAATDAIAEPPPTNGDRDRTPELRHRPGWAWLRIFRRYDEYEAALEDLEIARAARENGREVERV